MPLTPWPLDGGAQYQIQTAQVSLPSIVVGQQDIAVSWPADFGNSVYTVPQPGVEGGSLVIGLLSAVLKPGTRTGTACTITVKNTGLVSIAAGAVLHVLGVG